MTINKKYGFHQQKPWCTMGVNGNSMGIYIYIYIQLGISELGWTKTEITGD